VLVRPDKHVAWRSHCMPADPETELMTVLTAVLNREESA
jgi:2,4-dichlorophenol 6-monooxygenase